MSINPTSATTTTTTATTAGVASMTTTTTTTSNTASVEPPKRKLGKEELSEKKLRRLEKNRLSARECRRRKREATEQLQRQINVLEGDNLRLRLQLQIGQEAEDSLVSEQEKLTEEIDDLLKSKASESEVYATIEEFKEKFADYGRDRRSGMEFHLQNIERLLQPTQTTSIAMRALQGTNAVSSSASTAATTTAKADIIESSPVIVPPAAATPAAQAVASHPTEDSATTNTTEEAPTTCQPTAKAAAPSLEESKALFQHLVQYLQVTPEQAAALKDSRFIARELDESLAKSLSVLKDLRQRLFQTSDDLETEFNNVRRILTPTQAAKFLVWVANNRACMHMLDELWCRVYPLEGDDNDSDINNNPDAAADVEDSKQQASAVDTKPKTLHSI